MKIGSLEILPVLDGAAYVPLEEIVDREDGVSEWTCHEHPVDENGRLTLQLGGYLIVGKDRVILVDAGAGSVKKEDHVNGMLPDSIRQAGFDLGDVTDVVFTHLHWDHVGWATQQGNIMFPNATYRAHAADWQHFISGPGANPGAVKKLSPIEPKLELFDSESEFSPGVIARPAPGHTPGSTIFVVADQNERALLLGDVTHTVAELTDPEWYGLFDLDRDAARRIRNQISSEALDSGDAIAAAHFPGLGIGRLVTSAGQRRFHYI